MKNLQAGDIVFTEREADIISCLISGHTAKSIAMLLEISPNTVNVHTRNIIQKINGTSKNDLIKFVENSELYGTFRDRYDQIIRSNKPIETQEGKQKNVLLHKYRKYVLPIIVFLILVISLIITAIYAPTKTNIKSNVPVIFKNIFLPRTDVEKKIDQAFGDDKIGVAILVGYGGTGKTTIARHYFQSRRDGIVFEINAESQNALQLSLYKFASLLAETPNQREEINFMKNIENDDVKRTQFLHFISSQLKQRSGNWCILFDNVDDFSIIADCFPHDPNIWGSGKVIITTRNFNVEDVSFLNSQKIIKVGLLTDAEKSQLFNNIVRRDIPNSDTLLKTIPSMPLDVSIAAHYIKACKISSEDYLKTLHNAKFDSFKKSLLKNMTGYSQTRYSIVTTSFEKIIKENPTNKELLLMLSMLDSQNISKWYLLRYCDEATVDSFILNLKQYSLAYTKGDRLFVHRSTQEIGQKYLYGLFTAQEKSKIIEKIVNAMTPYECLMWYSYEKQEKQLSYKEINEIIPHLERLKEIISASSIPEKEKYVVRIMLALLYAYVPESNDQKMQELADEIIQRNHGFIEGQDLVALYLQYIYCGITSPSQKDEKRLKKCIDICSELKNDHLLAITYIYLSLIYCERNEAELCKHFLRESMKLAKTLKTRIILNYRYCEVGLSLLVSRKEIEEVLNFTLETLSALHASRFFYKTNEEYNAPEGAAKNCVAALRRIMVRIYNYIEKYEEALENCKEADFFYAKRVEKGDGDPKKRRASLEIEHANTLLRMNQLEEAEEKLKKAIKSRFEQKHDRGLFQAFTYKSEIDTRKNKLSEAYDDCLKALSYKKNSDSNSSQLMNMIIYYNMAVTKYKQGDLRKSTEHFKTFILLAKNFCANFLSDIENEKLINHGVFNIKENGEIKEYLNLCLQIFTIIYGKDHSFIRNFINTIK